MMTNTNITITGNLTGDPELRFTPSGKAVANFTVAVTPREFRDGEWIDGETAFWRCSVWNGVAENVAESFARGTRVIVAGRVQARTWEDKNGEKRYTTEILVDEIGASVSFATISIRKIGRGGRPVADDFDTPTASPAADAPQTPENGTAGTDAPAAPAKPRTTRTRTARKATAK